MSEIASEFFQSSDYLDQYKDTEQNQQDEVEIAKYVKNFEQQLEKKFQASETNKNYKFPRKKDTIKRQYKTKDEEEFYNTLQNASSYDIKSNDIKRYLQQAQNNNQQSNTWLAEVVFKLGQLDKNYLQKHFNKKNSKFLYFLKTALDKHLQNTQKPPISERSQMPTKKRFLSKRKTQSNSTFNVSKNNFQYTNRNISQSGFRNSTTCAVRKTGTFDVLKAKKKKSLQKSKEKQQKNPKNQKGSFNNNTITNKKDQSKKIKSMRINKKQSPLMLKKFKKRVLSKNKKCSNSQTHLEKFMNTMLNKNIDQNKTLIQKKKVNQTNLYNILQSRQKNKSSQKLNIEKKSLQNFLKKLKQNKI